MTPREHAQAALRATNGNCLCDSTPSDLDTLEAAIRAAAQPLVAALRDALDTGDGAWLGENGDDSWIRKRDGWLAALAAWEGK